MKKKQLFSGESKYDFLKKITNDEASNIRGGEAGTNTPGTNPPGVINNTPPSTPSYNGPVNVGINSFNPNKITTGVRIPL